MSPYRYGTPEQREPSRSSAIFRINPAKPVAMELVKSGFESPVARQFTFTRKTR
jgi:hypothetical protein